MTNASPKGSPVHEPARSEVAVLEINVDSLGFGSVSKDDSDRTTLKSERAGDQLCFKISIHMPPRSLMFMWYMLHARIVMS